MSEQVNRSTHTYRVYAKRKTSQFDQKVQEIRCHVLEAYRDYLLVESLKRYNRKYSGASKSTKGRFQGVPVRRVNRDQILQIEDERTGKVLAYETVRRREGTHENPGRSRQGGR